MAELEKNYCQMYGTNIYTMSQQKYSLLRNHVTIAEMKGVKRHFDRVHPTAAVRADSKYADTPLIPTVFDRRTVHATEYIWADMIDWQDDTRLFIDPASSIVQMGASAMGRITDDLIIKRALDGVAYEGEDGLTQVAFPVAQQIPITLGGSGGNTGFNLEKIYAARSLFGKADVDLSAPENQLKMSVSQAQLDDLFKSIDAGNKLYEAVRDLCTGQITRFLGFDFIITERLQKVDNGDTTSTRTCAAWCKSGVVLCEPEALKVTVETRSDKCDNWQAMAKYRGGATRIEDAKVVQIFCQE